MKHITLKVPDKHYEIFQRVSGLLGKTVEDLALASFESHISLLLSINTGDLLGLGDGPDYDHVFEDDKVFGEMFGRQS